MSLGVPECIATNSVTKQIQDGEESKIIFYYKYISYEEVSINSSV